ncbi:MerR family transcriptional regulator [Microlunatus soli]|uniref:DNA-binding transcriptional regulator, MerR family n=1 Tax=Microlunatus soli TaxID=630515 RepID=A0A1H1XNU7_9ACTN|nr:MerR family transcriptional regulator [Microlunatus soli]SDT10853.1 DNA-binding transcriptional regulator, MerR family [Microlunatus soli]
MRISELSRSSGVATATIKYYLREGLLHAGELTAATQAQYDDSHLDRLRLIRALLGPGRLSIAEIRGVLAAVDDPPESPNEMLGRASESLEPQTGGERSRSDAVGEEYRQQATAIVDELGWRVAANTKVLDDLAQALTAIDQAGLALIPGGVLAYARQLHGLAVAEVATVPMDSPEAAVRQAVLGTILIEPLLLALRRLALQDAAGRRFDGTDAPLA